MSINCKACGAACAADASPLTFVCEYCGTKNVDETYLKDYASKIDVAKANHHFQLAMLSIKSEDYLGAETNLNLSAREDANNPECWIYLAFCKAATVKPSNYASNFKAAKECLEQAKRLGSNSAIVENGFLAVSNKLLASSLSAAKYFFETAYKKHLAFSGSGNERDLALQEASRGFSLIRESHALGGNDANVVAWALVYAINQVVEVKKQIGGNESINEYGNYFAAELAKLFEKRRDLIDVQLKSYPKQQGAILKLIEKFLKKDNAQPINSGERHSGSISEASSINKNLLVVVSGVVVVCIAYFALNGQSTGPSVPRVSQIESPKVMTQQAAPTYVEHKATQPQSVVSESDRRSAPPISSPALASYQPSAEASSCGSINECVVASLNAAITEDIETIRRIAAVIDGFPKPEIGNRPISRKLNTEALEQLRLGNYLDAVQTLKKARVENSRDIEIASNLGYALVKSGNQAEAVNVLLDALILEPRRTSTWTPLAEALAQSGKRKEAIASLWIGYQWSGDRDKAIKFYTDQAERQENSQLRDLYAGMLQWLKGNRPF